MQAKYLITGNIYQDYYYYYYIQGRNKVLKVSALKNKEHFFLLNKKIKPLPPPKKKLSIGSSPHLANIFNGAPNETFLSLWKQLRAPKISRHRHPESRSPPHSLNYKIFTKHTSILKKILNRLRNPLKKEYEAPPPRENWICPQHNH